MATIVLKIAKFSDIIMRILPGREGTKGKGEDEGFEKV